MLTEGYHRLGYRLIELPRAPVADRVRFVLQTLGLPAQPAS